MDRVDSILSVPSFSFLIVVVIVVVANNRLHLYRHRGATTISSVFAFFFLLFSSSLPLSHFTAAAANSSIALSIFTTLVLRSFLCPFIYYI